MVRALLKRALHLLIVIWLVSLATFLLLQLVPGDPATAVLGVNGTPEQYAQVRAQLGLDQPMPQRYAEWIQGMLHGDFGRSLMPPHQSVAEALGARLPVTLQVGATGLLLALLVSVPMGIWAAHRKDEAFDRWSSTVVFALMSLPTFLLGLILIQLLVFNPSVAQSGTAVLGGVAVLTWANRLRRRRKQDGARWLLSAVALLVVALVLVLLVMNWPTLPRQGFSRITDEAGIGANLKHIVLPALTVALGELALFTRVLRAEMIGTLDADFVLAARAKGMPTRRILTTEALRPASFSIVTIAGISLGRLMGGTLIVEVLFNLPGMGRLLVESIEVNDFVTVQAGVLVLAVIYVTVNAVVDVVYTLLDPRVRHAG